MDDLLELIKKYRITSDEYDFYLIYKKLIPLFNKYIFKVKSIYREDLLQEITITLLIVIRIIDIEKLDSKNCFFLINNKIKDTYKKFVREIKKYTSMIAFSLNDCDEFGKELIDNIENCEVYKEPDFYLEEEDDKFIRLFIDDDRILTQNEVAKKCHYSQQSISRKLKKIKNKYQKK